MATLALIIGIVCGFALGALAAVRRTTWIDRGITSFLSVISVIPAFVIGIILVEVVAVELKCFRRPGSCRSRGGFWPWLSHVLLPALALSLGCMSNVARQLRAGLIGAYRENYVIGAVVRGLSPRRIFFRHVLRNGIGPAVAVLGLEFPALIGKLGHRRDDLRAGRLRPVRVLRLRRPATCHRFRESWWSRSCWS